MPITVYNTLTRKKEDFEPSEPGKVRMYVCGPTVYDSAHIGHARSVVVFDVVYRYFRDQGWDVTYVRNFTDVDDKIINRANELGEDTTTLSRRYIDEFHEDMGALNVLIPTHEPRATEYIGAIIEVVKILVEKGHAYEAGGDVFFRVESFPGYGKLSGRKLEDMEAGSRVDVNKAKENPHDFVLWKAAKPGEPQWDSPWGAGRPGWHIECSAMSMEHLGMTFDIHGGGKDLIFPHHENEIAQSEAAFGATFVRYWMHNGFVNIDSEKMSKSLGNFKTIRNILEQYHPEVIRLFLLSKHYRSPVDFTEQAIHEARSGLERMYAFLDRMEQEADIADMRKANGGPYWERFRMAMDDDFNTAAGLGILFEAVRKANRLLDAGVGELPMAEWRDILRMGKVLGILEETPAEFAARRKELASERTGVDPARVEELIAKRAEARKNKDFATADAIRDELAEMGVQIKDGPEGTTWSV
ncbi:MAG: cysteine--tRNA ligase [Desulfatibacillaceae bacterium]